MSKNPGKDGYCSRASYKLLEFEQLLAAMGSAKANLVISDMAPNMSGIANSHLVEDRILAVRLRNSTFWPEKFDKKGESEDSGETSVWDRRKSMAIL